MLDWLNFRLGEIIDLIHALEKRYYQNKTQLRYNFGSVYKCSPYVVMLILGLFSLNFIFIFVAVKIDSKLTLHQMRKPFIT